MTTIDSHRNGQRHECHPVQVPVRILLNNA